MCVWSRRKSQTGLRQRQQIHEPETYLIDVQGISYVTLSVCLIGKNIFEEGGGKGRGAETLDWTMKGEIHMTKNIFGVGDSDPEGHHAYDI